MTPSDGELLRVWKAYISHREVLPGVSPLIAESWERCWPLINPYQPIQLRKLNPTHLLATQVSSFDLLTIARPVMEDIYQYIEGSDSAVVLVNSAAYILDLLGDADVVDRLMDHSMLRGVSLAESDIGTNAFALALLERVPNRVYGAEHFRQVFHNFAEVAAPIFHLTGKPLGALGIVTLKENYHLHTLGVVVAGARAIEAQRGADRLLVEKNRQFTRLNAILSSISEGILVWDVEGRVTHVNPAAAELLHLSPSTLMGNRLREWIRFSPAIQQAIEMQSPLDDVETEIHVTGKALACVLSVRYVRVQGDVKATIAILREVKAVRQLVQRHLGAHTSFTLDNLIGPSPAMKRVRRLARTAAKARASVLLRGESGTGKNLLARAIHHLSPRHQGPFVIFACASIPKELLLPELLGYDYLPSREVENLSRPSKFELADGGTLFFQDVDTLPLEGQTILLNFLEIGVVKRLESNRAIEADVRIIAATSAPLEKLVAEGSFRADLFYRLSAFEIVLPPLRRRKQDLAPLIQRNLAQLSEQYGIEFRLADETMQQLLSYPWPGNVGELESVLSRAAGQASPSHLISPLHLPDFVLHPKIQTGMLPEAVAPVTSLREVERDTLLRAARLCHGNMTQMAKMLGVGRTTVWRRVKKYGIPLEKFRTRDDVSK